MTINVEMLENAFPSFQSTFIWMLVLVVVELAMLIFGSLAGAVSFIDNLFYCETHNIWYTAWRQSRFRCDLSKARAAIDSALLRLDVEPIRNGLQEGWLSKQGRETTYPHLLIELRCCPSSSSCDFGIKVTSVWQEQKKDEAGNVSTTTHRKLLHDTLIPSKLGIALHHVLGLPDMGVKWHQNITQEGG